MPKVFLGTLAATAVGLAALTIATGSAYTEDGDGGVDYRLIGCVGPPDGPFPQPTDPTFTVSFSSSPDDIGEPCESVLTSLGKMGFRVIEVRPELNFSGIGPEARIGALHYLERRKDD